MRKTIYILFAAVLIGLASCSSKSAPDHPGWPPDNSDSEKETLITDTTKHNHTDPPPINTIRQFDDTRVYKSLDNVKNEKMVK